MSTRLKPKLLSVMKTYHKDQFIKDVIAGLIVAIIALPLSIALAISSGVSPEQGLYTAIVAGFLFLYLGEVVFKLVDQVQRLWLLSIVSSQHTEQKVY